MLDAVIRRDEQWAGAWRQRLALAAAAVTTRQAGRVEDEAALRDAVLLTRPRDSLSVGPAGRLLLVWRRLAVRPPQNLLTEKNLAAVLEEFIIAWSLWRRRHQATAAICHYKRRGHAQL